MRPASLRIQLGWAFVVVVLGATLGVLSQPASDQAVCNGHGRPHPQSSTLPCQCEWPYVGDQCEACRQGFYGNPRNGDPCTLDCSGGRVLSNFTFAGIGVSDTWTQTPPPLSTQPFCWWIISPTSPAPSMATPISEYFLALRNSTASADTFNISFQFYSNFEDSHDLPCCVEKVLVYNGLPQFIHSLINQDASRSNPGLLSPLESVSVPYADNLVAVYTGMDLESSQLSVLSSLLTVVYLYPGKVLAGFNATVTVGEGEGTEFPEEEAADMEEYQPQGMLLPYPSCPCDGGMDMCECEGDPFTTISIPSLTSSLATPTNHTPYCSSRIHHSVVYDGASDLMYVFGGVDLSGVVCAGDVVRVNLGPLRSGGGAGEWVWSGGEGSGWEGSGASGDSVVSFTGGGGDGVGPSGRYLHTATLFQCGEGGPGCVLVLGGITSSLTHQVSDQLWLFNISTKQWRLRANSPVPVASHTATITEEGVVIVIGGVSQDLTLQASIMTYHIRQDSWEVWPPINPAVSGIYGHTAVYYPEMQSVLVHGGVYYEDHTPSPSPSLYSLHLPTQRWSLIRKQVLSLVFHSSVIVSHQLLLSGGLVGGCGLEGACSNDLLTIVNLNSTASTSIEVSPPLPNGWGHRSVAGTRSEAIFLGATAGGSGDTVTFLHDMGSLCSLALNHTRCHALLQCAACVNVSDDSLLACYSTHEASGSVRSSMCSLIGGEVVHPNNSDVGVMECGSFSSCRECLLIGGANGHGCSWCTCSSDRTPRCTNSPSGGECLCDDDVCQSNICGHLSCRECVNDTSCSWYGRGSETARCVAGDDELMMDNVAESLDTCPAPCGGWGSCRDCVSAPSPLQGPSKCVWDSYTWRCGSEVSLPLLCIGGTCGAAVRTPADCPISCSNSTSCDQCLLVPECVWLQVRGQAGQCAGVVESAIFDATSSQSAVDGVHYLECPNCVGDCGEHGSCNLNSLECDCDFGFVGEECAVECECNGHSDCVDQSAAGRRICTSCLNNTKGEFCEECEPLFVGSGVNGGRCVPCLEFCGGNSEVCATPEDRSLVLGVLGSFRNVTAVRLLLTSGPSSPENAMCFSCANGSSGDRCEDCRHGYYHSRPSMNTTCTRCSCNGHGDGCDQDTGVCTCLNNTLTVHTNNQCSACANGYVGRPMNGSQCYRQQALSEVVDITLPINHVYLVAVGRNIVLSDSDITLTLAVVSGVMDVYVSTNPRAVGLDETRRRPGEFVVVIQSDTEVVSRTRRSVSGDVIVDGGGNKATPTPGEADITKREIQSDTLPSDLEGPVYQYQVDERLTLVIPHNQPDFQQAFHYVTIISQQESRFLFDYRQTTLQLNLYAFFSIFFSCVIFMATVLVLSWKLFYFIIEQWRAALERKLRKKRANRPLYRIIVYLHDGKGESGESGVAGANTADYCTDRDYEEVDAKLRSKAVLLLDGKPTYITKTAKGRGGVGGADTRKPKNKTVTLDPSELEAWPVVMQPTVDERASVHSVIVQLPSAGKSLRHVVCAGSTLVNFTGMEKKGRKVPRTKELRWMKLENETSEGPQSREVELEAAGVRPQSRDVELEAEGSGEVEHRSKEVELEGDSSGGVELQSREKVSGGRSLDVEMVTFSLENDQVNDGVLDTVVSGAGAYLSEGEPSIGDGKQEKSESDNHVEVTVEVTQL